MTGRWPTTLLITICLALGLAACGSEDGNEPVPGTDSETPTTAISSPTSEPSATPTPLATISPTPPSPASPTTSATSSPPAATSIAGLTTLDWQLVEIDGTPALDGSIMTFSLARRDENYIDGHADCHGYRAGIAWDDASFRIDENAWMAGLHTDERPCQTPAGGVEQNSAYFGALTEITAYQATDELLTLLDADGQPRLIFVPRQTVTVDPALTGSSWWLVEMNGASPLPGTSITLAFNSDGVDGHDGCNELFGSLLAAGDGRLTVVESGGTDMGCETPEGIMAQAERFAETLLHATGYRVDGDQLHIMDSSGAANLRFTRQGAAIDAALAAHAWELVEIDGRPALSEPLVTLELAEGSISGHDGCNAFRGELMLFGGGALDVSSLVQTLIGCDAAIAEQASIVTGYLSFATYYRLDGDRLVIGKEEGLQLVFAPLDTP